MLINSLLLYKFVFDLLLLDKATGIRLETSRLNYDNSMIGKESKRTTHGDRAANAEFHRDIVFVQRLYNFSNVTHTLTRNCKRM